MVTLRHWINPRRGDAYYYTSPATDKNLADALLHKDTWGSHYVIAHKGREYNVPDWVKNRAKYIKKYGSKKKTKRTTKRKPLMRRAVSRSIGFGPEMLGLRR